MKKKESCVIITFEEQRDTLSFGVIVFVFGHEQTEIIEKRLHVSERLYVIECSVMIHYAFDQLNIFLTLFHKGSEMFYPESLF